MSASQVQELDPTPAQRPAEETQPQAAPLPYAALVAYAEGMALFGAVFAELGEIVKRFEVLLADPDPAVRETLCRNFQNGGLRLIEVVKLTGQDPGRAKAEAARLSKEFLDAREAVDPLLGPVADSVVKN